MADHQQQPPHAGPQLSIDAPERRPGIELGHQEVQRIIEELDTVYTQSQTEWLQAAAVAEFLCLSLGYEDVQELEDALQGTFTEFLSMLPNVRTTFRPDPETQKPALYFQVVPEPPQDQWVCKRLEYHVRERNHLWNVLLKSSHARVEVPDLGLEFAVDGRKKIDTVWNYLSAAALDLGMHVQTNVGITDDETDKTLAVIEGLAALRDLERPWTLVVVDPSGTSTFSDMTDVVVIDNYVDTGSHVDQP
ncbi:hypothetical protein AMAG_14044 [Allomyces macrogynus ATCC 38327]|uniref:ZPR1 jelly-roll domain-containing protein n=1 Tax=Allomyces macrogynus (strain ATCC 38327) TaxID=578462 RepID=A0A0L0T4M7_ALLM3|nr:hypothetical protein AMAG_14044 [Allomyces macrogynus ATCC 38327]|eukprot:KNE69474.1 hypothetical protein AMAG_14044 [Allomyces macrogynus ATCC 38327]